MGIGKRIKEARLNKGLTQEELAKSLGLTKGAIANYENEVSHPKEQVMYALIEALGVDPNFLFQDCVDIGTKRAPSLSDGAIRIARTFDCLDDWGKRQVQAVANNELARCTETTPDTSGQERAEPDLAEKVAELERQNKELAAKVATMEEEDARMEAAAELSLGKPFSGDAKTG